jgi:hypothetical protein
MKYYANIDLMAKARFQTWQHRTADSEARVARRNTEAVSPGSTLGMLATREGLDPQDLEKP